MVVLVRVQAMLELVVLRVSSVNGVRRWLSLVECLEELWTVWRRNKSKQKERPGNARVAKHLNNDTRYSFHVCGENWDRWRENIEKTTGTVRS